MIEHDLRIFLIDLDDTIYDRTPHRFGVALTRAAASPILKDFAPEALLSHVEAIRSLSPMFEELGYPPTQDRTHRRLFLAAILLVFGSIPRIANQWGIPTATLRAARRLVARFQAILDQEPPATWRTYLAQQLLIRRALAGTGSVEVREVIDRLSIDDQILALANQTADSAPWESRDGFLEAWSGLTRAGVNCYVASEGEEALQSEKLASLGLESQLRYALLTSERAASPLDALAFRRHTDRVFAETADALGESVWALDRSGQLDPAVEQRIATKVTPDVTWLAAARWVLSTFARKTPGYYARILHAILVSPDNPQPALDALVRANSSDRSPGNARVAMFGNYHAKDVVPIQQLLGRGRVWTGLLDQGLHRGIRPSDADFVPTQTFPNWGAAVEELRLGIPWDSIEPLRDVRLQPDEEVVSLLNQARADLPFLLIGKLADFLAG